MIDPRRLRPGELCRLLNSTPLGEVINARQLKRHRERAGLRIGDARHVDLLRYTAWLLQVRHASKPVSDKRPPSTVSWAEAAEGAAALARTGKQLAGHGQKLTRKQDSMIAALLTEPSYAAAAAKAGVGPRTLHRWLHLPGFRAAYRQARREVLEFAIGHAQADSVQAIETLRDVACNGRRDSDRVRAACAQLYYAMRGIRDADLLHGEPPTVTNSAMDSGDVVQLLTVRLQQLNAADLPSSVKARLTVTLGDALLRAVGVDEQNQRQEALEAVLLDRKEKR
jgi:hypothetical protein